MIKMNSLEDARKKINEIDRKMADLFTQRMHAAEQVANYKMQAGLPIYDQAREDEVIEKNRAFVPEEELQSYYVNFLKSNMIISRRYQRRLLDGMRVAYSGVPGAFAATAAQRIFPDGTPVPHKDFAAAYEAVTKGECDCAVLPLENSFAGDVSQVMDLAFFGDLYINGIYDLEITQNLIGLPGTSLKEIKKVISHPQALAQSAAFLREHGFETEEATNTAVAAQSVAEKKDPAFAAVAGAETAALYGLQVLEKRINDRSGNTTRFAVFSRLNHQDPAHDNYFVMNFTVKNEAGCLGKAVSAIGELGFNLRALKSRPTKELIWEYYFYAEGEGNINSKDGICLQKRLQELCSDMRILGSFDRERVLDR